jgi:AbrB family looped-hinge helix DNA binding protein
MDFERQIIELGSSLAITIPADLAKYFNMEKGQKVTISDDEDKIIIRKNDK